MSKYFDEYLTKTRTISRRARFHAPYIRAKSSNIIHRSLKTGRVKWRHPRASGDHEIRYWYIRPICPRAEMTNPLLLSAKDVKMAKPIETAIGPTQIVLCKNCFPSGSGEHTPLRMAVMIEG